MRSGAAVRGCRRGPGQVNAAQDGDERRRGGIGNGAIVRLKSGPRALCRVGEAGISGSEQVPGGVGHQTRRIDRGVRKTQAEALGQEGVLEGHSHFHVMDALHIGKIAAQTQVGQLALLSGSLGKIRQGICAGVIVELVVPCEEGDIQQGAGAEQVGPSRRNVVGLDLCALILAS